MKILIIINILDINIKKLWNKFLYIYIIYKSFIVIIVFIIIKNLKVIIKSMMKKQTVFIILFILCFLTLWGQSWKKTINKVYLKASNIQSSDSPSVMGLLKIKEIIEKDSEGRINIEVYDSGLLGSEIDTIIQTQMGLIDINIVNVNSITHIVKELKVLTLPYLIKNDDHLWKVLNGKIGIELLKSLETQEVIGLGFYDAGRRGFFNNIKDINNIDDFKDLRTRIQNNEIMIEMVKALGAIPVPVEINELYSEINFNTEEVVESNIIFYYSKKLYEKAKYFSFNEFLRIPDIIIMNKKTWNTFVKKDQDIIMNAVKESIQYQRELMKKQTNDTIEKCKKAGCRFDLINDNEQFKNAMFKVYENHVLENLDFIISINNLK